MLAADCLRDVGVGRAQGEVALQVQRRLREALEARPPIWRRWLGKVGVRNWIEGRSTAMEALVRAGAGYWTLPYGMPEWVEVPAGEFWMGTREEDVERLAGGDKDLRDWFKREVPQHSVHLPAFYISRVPITNAQYHLFVEAAGHKPPEGWEEGRPPRGKESHPVVSVSWHDALAYCRWLEEQLQVSGSELRVWRDGQLETWNMQPETLVRPPAQRGGVGKGGAGRPRSERAYPWGDAFDAARCNSGELGLGDTTPVGIFPGGASPYGVLDMAGNVWEWTCSVYQGYPYDPADGRENLEAATTMPGWCVAGRSTRSERHVRCAFRYRFGPDRWDRTVGFRVVLGPGPL